MAILASIDYSHTYNFGTQTNGQVFIKIIDSATGQATNGNNVPVTYQQNINGSQGIYTINIPGQSKAIYSGRLGNTDPADRYFTSFTILSIGAVPDDDPPVFGCDLSVPGVHVDKDESAPGAADAQITISATSSFGPVQYSLDMVNYQASPTFTGLSGGNRTVYVRDGNNCQNQSSVNIKTITNLLTADPSVTLPDGNISRWNAAFNPIVFTYQRKDFGVVGITQDNATGYAVVQVNISLNALEVKGGYVYVNTPLCKGTFQIHSVDSASKRITLKTPFNGHATGFININQLRPYYKIITRITYQDRLTGNEAVIEASNRPDSTGLVKADFSNFLQSLLLAKDESNYTAQNYRDDNLSAYYKIAFAEHWDDATEPGFTSAWVTLSAPYYVVYAAKQLGDKYGGNLAAYVPFATLAHGLPKAKWITDFAEPALSNGYPFDIGFIYSESLVGRNLYCDVTLLDINRQPLPGGAQTNYLLNDNGSWLLNNDGSRMIISRQTSGNLPVPGQLGLNRLLIDANFNADVYYLNITLKFDDNGNTYTVTETQTLRVDDAVEDSAVYLRWIGLTGSWNYYRFVFNQEVSLDVQNAVIIKNFVHDWEYQEGIDEVISKTAGQKIKVVAEDLSINDIKGLQSIKFSPKVQMLINKNPVRWQTVVINTATYAEYETRNGQAPFSVTFSLPAINIQSQ